MSETKYKVLVVEDDKVLANKLSSFLRKENFLCTEALSAAKAKRVIVKARPDIVVLDLNLPDEDGMQLLSQLRSKDDLPVIVVSGRGTDGDKLKGLSVGADDYLTKPFNPSELVLRIKTILKRTYKNPSISKLSFGSILLDLDTRMVRKENRAVPLTAKEFDLLVFLSKNPRHVYSREEILENVWSSKSTSSAATVTEHVRRLRQKLEDDPASPRHLCAVRSSGYQFIP